MSPKHMRKELSKRLKEDLVVVQQEEVKIRISHDHYNSLYVDTVVFIQATQNMLLTPAISKL